MFCNNSSGQNDDNNNTINNKDNKNLLDNTRIFNEAKNQKSLVRSTGKNKSLVPYIGSVLIIPVQKPLFPGFSSMLYLKDENLKTYFIEQFKKRMESTVESNVENETDKPIDNTEWIGLFLSNPKAISNTDEPTDESTDDNPIWHPALDEVNSDMHHFVEILPKAIDDIFEHGVLAKIDYNDETTNIAEFIKLENNTNNNKDDVDKKKEKKDKKIPFPVNKLSDPLVLKVISARRIKLDSVCEYEPWLKGNIQHLQPNINISGDNATTDNEDEITTRSAFNVASDILRRLYSDDPDNRRDMIQLWSARHHIDIGFFCDFAASITNSTPRELQKLLQCINYSDRLELLCKLLKREEFMIKKRDEIISNVDTLIKKEDENQYLRMILHTIQRRLMINYKERNMLVYGNNSNNNNNNNNNNNQSQTQADNNSNIEEDKKTEEKKDRYERLAQKFKDRMGDKIMCDEAKEVFDDGIEKLLNAKNKESLDIETTKQYLDWISSLPWNYCSEDNNNIQSARNILDEDHYGMKLIKERILEVIACNILNNNNNNKENSKILCLIGPPGVGKTSIGSSIARALNKEFFKFSLGGSDDSHLLKGFLRTYAGSQPGKIIYGLKQCGTANPLILIDEIDKMGARHSDPSHALLEILDPAQNKSFSDNYLDFQVDLSKILFVCTANDENQINPILKDRLQIIYLNGYDEHEKLEIAKKYLIPNALEKCGLKKNNISLSDHVIIELIKWYSRESGVRSLAQNIEKILNKATLQLVEAGITAQDINNKNEINDDDNNNIDENNNKKNENENENENGNKGTKILEKFSNFVKRIGSDSNGNDENCDDNNTNSDDCGVVDSNNINQEIPFIEISVDNLKQYVGLRKYQNDRTYIDDKLMPFGVVTGLAYTTNGGCITYIETIKYKKSDGGSIKATGQLGKVMNESVEISQCLARSILLNKIDSNNKFFDEYNIHLHCPEGGIAKDGPSAGITMVTALLSLALDQKISSNIAMTGEITLTGKILKIGGLKEKLLAAKRANINTLILPFDNFDDFYDNEFGIPKYLRDEFTDVHFVKHYDEVLTILFNNYLPLMVDNIDIDDDNKICNTFPQQIHLNNSLEMPKPL